MPNLPTAETDEPGEPAAVFSYLWTRSDDRLVLRGQGRVAGIAPETVATGGDLDLALVAEDRERRRALIAADVPFARLWRLAGDAAPTVLETALPLRPAPDAPSDRLIGTLTVSPAASDLARAPAMADDGTPGLVDRAVLLERLGRAIEEAAESGRPGVLVALGLEDLRLIHDGYGTAEVEAVVAEAAVRIGQALRATDSFARIGSDRFALLLPDCPAGAIPRIAEKLLAAFRGRPVIAAGSAFPISIGLGLTALPHQAPSPAEAVARAEGALREARAMGHDCYAAYDESEQRRQESRRILAIGAEFMQAVQDDRLFFAYQPVIRTTDRRVSYHECLLRMRMSDGRIAVAGTFVPVVERLRLARTLDELVLRLVVDDLSRHPQRRLAINISAVTTGDRSWLQLLRMLLGDRPDMAQRLLVEVTETTVMRDIGDTARFLAELRALGCRTSLDDFGAGHTAFRHLIELPFDVIKLDGSLTRGFMDDPVRLDFIRSVVALAHTMGRSVVAEYVESEEEMARLRDAGVDHLQGYFLGAPAFRFAD